MDSSEKVLKFTCVLNMTSAIRFASEASRQCFDIDVIQGRYKVNGKSVMGLFSLNLCNDVTVVVHASIKEASKFLGYIRKTIRSEIEVTRQ